MMTKAMGQREDLKRKLQSGDLDGCKALLQTLKIVLTKIGFLPVDDSASHQQLYLAREILELGAQWSIKAKDVTSFERYMAQLKPYYFDFNLEGAPESSFKDELLGLNLLCLLSQNKIADFHMELERLDPTSLHSNIYIKHPVTLEQYLMEGAYNKVFLSRGSVPAESYSYFVDQLVGTIRDEIASCCEKAYKTLPTKALAALLMLDNANDVKAFSEQRGWEQSVDSVKFPDNNEDTSHTNINQMIKLNLDYAKELEKIV